MKKFWRKWFGKSKKAPDKSTSISLHKNFYNDIGNSNIYSQLDFLTPEEIKHIILRLRDFTHSYEYYAQNLYKQQLETLEYNYNNKMIALDRLKEQDIIDESMYKDKVSENNDIFNTTKSSIIKTGKEFLADNDLNIIVLKKIEDKFNGIVEF